MLLNKKLTLLAFFLAVNGEWLELYGCGICNAIGENPLGGRKECCSYNRSRFISHHRNSDENQCALKRECTRRVMLRESVNQTFQIVLIHTFVKLNRDPNESVLLLFFCHAIVV